MLSPAQISRQKALAAKLGRAVPVVLGIDVAAPGSDMTVLAAAGADSAPVVVDGGREISERELLLAHLGVDLRKLHGIQALEKKLEAKAVMIDAYLPWVEGLLKAERETGRGVQDEVLVQMMIWLLDLGRYEQALPLIGYVLRYKLALPERFKRTAATLIAEESADAALKALGQGKAVDLGFLLKIDALTGDLDMIDQVRAKLMKAIGLVYHGIALQAAEDDDGAAGARRSALANGLRYLGRALELDSKAGVKTALRDLERAEAKLQEDKGQAA
jgi:hypothetical protein